MQTPEARALELLEPMASMDVLEAAKRAVTNGTHVWNSDQFGNFGLVELFNRQEAVIIVYPETTNSPPDFEVNERWLDENL